MDLTTVTNLGSSYDGVSNVHWKDLLVQAPSRGHGTHVVQFYKDDAFLASTVALFAAAGLHKSEGVVIIAIRDHRALVIARLESLGFDVPQLMQRRQLMVLDASETLAKFMIDGAPDPRRFKELIGGLLRELKARYQVVRAYGEMVGLLRDAGNVSGCDALEELWNGLAETITFSLLCGYSLNSFGQAGDAAAFARVCDSHSHTLPDETFVRLDATREQFRDVARLQQRVLALELELEELKELRALRNS